MGVHADARIQDDLQSQEFLRGHTDEVTCLAVSVSSPSPCSPFVCPHRGATLSHHAGPGCVQGNGALLASGSCGRKSDVVVWDAASRSEIFRYVPHPPRV